ncbi:MAG: hypothetical protein V4502_12455 [Pseudomonadota bacterium]
MNRSWLNAFGWIAAAALADFLIYVGLFAIGAAAGVKILFYRGVILGLVAAAIVFVAFALLFRGRDPSLVIASAAVSFSLNVCFLVLLPVTVDRSVTVYLLSTIDRQDDRGINPAALEQAFIKGYVVDMHAIGRRIDEQRRSGNISVGSDGKVRLTDQGRRFMRFSRMVARLFGTDPRFVRGPDEREPAAAEAKAAKRG